MERWCCLIGLFLVPGFPGFGQEIDSLPRHVKEAGYPFIQNYTPEDYSAFEQNWAVLQDSAGILYFGNGDGVLVYDGVHWELITLSNQGSVLSLALAENGRVYVGGIGEVGYLEADAVGRLSYVSLLPYLDKEDRKFNDVWNTYATPEGVYFRTRKALFRWREEQFKVWKSDDNNLFQSYWIHNTLFLQNKQEGLMHMQDDTLRLLPGGEFFASSGIYTMLPFDNKKIVIGMWNHGLFLYDGQRLLPFPTQSDAFLEENQPYCGTLLNDSTFAIGTLQGGIVVIDKQGKQKLLLHQEDLLVSPTVYTLYQDKANILWAGLSVGIAKIEYPSPFSRLDEAAHLDGIVNRIIRYQDKIYAGTDRGLFVLDTTQTNRPIFHPVHDLKNVVWDVLHTHDALLVALPEGVYQLKDDKVTRLLINNPTYLQSSKLDPNRVFVGLDDGLSTIYFSNGQWKDEGKIPEVFGAVYDVVETLESDLWLETNVNSLWRVSFQDKNKALHLEDPIVEEFGIDHGLPDDVGQIHGIDGQLFFRSYFGKQIYSFNEQTQSFHLDQSLPNKLGVSDKIVEVNWVDEDGNIWFDALDSEGRETKMVAWKQENGTFLTEDLQEGRIADIVGMDIFPELEDGVVWYGGKSGVIRHDLNFDNKQKVALKALVRKVTYQGDSLIFGGNLPQEGTALGNIVLPFRDNNFRLSYVIPSYVSEKANQYQYFLEGFDQHWSAWTSETQKDYTNLPEGEYIFKVRARNIHGQLSEEGQFTFTILPPWFRTWWAYLLYALAFFSFMGLVVSWRSARLHREKEALEATVEERTEEIRQKNAQLAQQAEQLKEMDQMKSHLFANISHEFRTPLTLIKGPVDQLLQQPEKSLTSENAQMIRRNTNRLLRLVNQLLDLSKLDAGKLALTPTDGEVYKWLRTIGAAFSSHAEHRGMVYEVQISQQPLWASFDHDKMEQIVYNLLSNAFKFTPDAGEVRFSAAYGAPWLTIQICDNGKGIPSDRLSHIFNRFYQVDDSYTREQEGTGIGLALTKELVTLMGGKIRVKSEVGKGTTFTINLPLTKSGITDEEFSAAGMATTPLYEDEREEVERVAAEQLPEEEASIVLVVEDNADMRSFIKEQLYADYQIVEAVHGKEGLAFALEKIPDLIITDLMMPQMDGIMFCEQLKNDERTSHIPVIMLTAKAGQEHKIEGLETGADDYLTKPFSVEELKIRVKNLITQREQLRKRFSGEMILQPSEVTLTNKDEEFLRHAISVVEQHMGNDQFTVEEFQKQMGMSRMQLHRKLKALTDQSATEFIRLIRMKRAAQLFMQKEVTVSEVAYEVGFTDPSYFAKCFKEVHAMTPKEYIQKIHSAVK